MGRIECFEDLVAWQRARELTRSVYLLTGAGAFRKDFALRDQICKAAISAMSNIAEGFERGKPGEFQHFLSMAKGSCGEVRSDLYVALDASHISSTEFTRTIELAREVGRLLGGLRKAVQEVRDRA